MRISVHVKPNSKKGPLVEEALGVLTLYVREPAVDGKANTAAIEAIAQYYKVSKSSVRIIRGATSRFKIAEVTLERQA